MQCNSFFINIPTSTYHMIRYPLQKQLHMFKKPDVNTQHVNSITHVNYENNPIYKMRKESEQKKVT